MEMTTKKTDAALIVSIKGRIDGEYPMQVRRHLSEWLDEYPFIILDCQELEYIDSSGLGALLFVLRKALEKGGDIRIAAPVPAVMMVLELTRTEKIFQVSDTVEDALAS